MSFDSSAYLRRATGRAKSDVANKLVSMLLHEFSGKVCSALGMGITDPRYTAAVAKAFGSECCYCGRPLENDRAAVEHLDGMNRFRVGLHIPGNVILACMRCNREKRRDDAIPTLVLAETGWESFLAHDSGRCREGCKSCAYWRGIWPNPEDRSTRLESARCKIRAFRADYPSYLDLNAKARRKLSEQTEGIYRDCQDFATSRIRQAVEGILHDAIPGVPVQT